MAMKEKDLEGMEIVGILAYVYDDQGKVNVLAYEPVMLFEGNPQFAKDGNESLYFIVIIGTGAVILLGSIAMWYRKKSIQLKRRLAFELSTQG